MVKRSIDKNNQSDEYITWEVVDLELHQSLPPTEVKQGDVYYLNQTIPTAIAAIVGEFTWSILALYLDFFAFWNLKSSAGYDICNAFQDDLSEIYNEFSEVMDINHILGPKMED